MCVCVCDGGVSPGVCINGRISDYSLCVTADADGGREGETGGRGTIYELPCIMCKEDRIGSVKGTKFSTLLSDDR